MTTQISGDTGISQVQDASIAAKDLAGGTGSGNLTQYTAAVTPLPSSGVSFSASHSLGAVPSEAVLEITCLTAELGYSIGDVIEIRGAWNGSNILIPSSVSKSTSAVGFPVTPGHTLYVQNKSTGASASPTAANWSYRFRLRAA